MVWLLCPPHHRIRPHWTLVGREMRLHLWVSEGASPMQLSENLGLGSVPLGIVLGVILCLFLASRFSFAICEIRMGVAL